MLQTLLLNSTYESISFISDKKVFKLIAKDKVEVLAYWKDKITWGSGSSCYPAIIRLKHHVRWIPKKARFNRPGVFKRDQNVCQYCGEFLTANKLTVDHVIPKAQGGINSWKNCVCACFECNNKKSNKTPEQAKMKLLNKPVVPELNIRNEYRAITTKHHEWGIYLGI
jgi:5-methylcytosine-specific restriction endonuclease McrA